MDSGNWVIVLYLGLLLLPMVYLQRILQREIQAFFLLVTRQPEISMALFSLLFLPGVLLHETSHYLMARLLGVRTGRFSIIPRKLEGGRIRLGYVETASTDFFRDALIGLAPLVIGGAFIGLVGVSKLGLNMVLAGITHGQLTPLNMTIQSIIAQPDFWLWFYLVFTVSSTMMPSASDRRAWLPLILVIVIVMGLLLLIGLGSWLLTRFGSAVLTAVDAIIMVFGLTVFIHLILLLPLFLIRRGISRLVGLRVS